MALNSNDMKNIWIIANWKSNMTIAEALGWLDVVGPNLQKRESLKVVVCPVFTDITEVKKEVMVQNYPLMVGSQDLSPFDSGSYTGEEAAKLLKDLVDLSILGHSERRQNFGESDEMVAAKTARAKEYNITPLVCVTDENTPVPGGVNLIAYEPVFAIGTCNADTPQNANGVAQKLKARYPDVQILYGGSVTADNAKAFLQQEDISGLLIGKSSLDPKEFLKIIEIASNI